MSLKGFHLFFIAVCLAFGIWLCAWGVRDYRDNGAPGSLVLAGLAALMALSAVPYTIWFLRKLRHVSSL